MRRIFAVLSAAALFAFVASTAWAQSSSCPANALGQASAPITSLPYTIGQTDQCLLKVFNSSGSGVVKIPAPGTAGGFLPNFWVQLQNIGNGTLTLTPQAPATGGSATTINGASTIALAKGAFANLSIGTDGKWYAATSSGSTGGVCTVPNGCTGDAALTAHNVLLGEGTSPVAFAAPGSTGIPLISQGASSDPVFGTAVVAGGGTGAATLTAHGVLVGEGTSAITPLAIATTGQLLQGATGADPAFATTLSGAYTFSNALITYGNAGGAPTHIATAAQTAPALTSCGTGSPAITGTDEAGIVTMGTGATGCVITFNVAYTGTPFCVVSWIATPLASQSYVTSNAAITLTQTSASGNKAQYICRAPAGG